LLQAFFKAWILSPERLHCRADNHFARRLIGAHLPIASPGGAYAIQLAGGLLATVLAATVSYFVVERPFLRLKRRVTVIESRPV